MLPDNLEITFEFVESFETLFNGTLPLKSLIVQQSFGNFIHFGNLIFQETESGSIYKAKQMSCEDRYLIKESKRRKTENRLNSSGAVQKRPNLSNQVINTASTVVATQPIEVLHQKKDVTSLICTVFNPATNKKTFQCSFCLYNSGIQIGNMKRHIEQKHLPQSVVFKCLKCDGSFKNKETLKNHYKKVHLLLDLEIKDLM